MVAGTIARRMAAGEKPYRVYKSGRARGKVPLPSRPGVDEAPPSRGGRTGPSEARRHAGASAGSASPCSRSGVLLILARRLERRELPLVPRRRRRRERAAPDVGQGRPHEARRPARSQPTTILLLGTDHAAARRAPTSPLRLDHARPHRSRASTASTTCRSRATCTSTIPGYGNGKINAAYQLGGPALAMKTVSGAHRPADQPRRHRRLQRVQEADRRDRRHHGRRAEADPVEPLRLPVHRHRCAATSGTAGAFAKGPQHMNGERALIYSRIRENQLDPAENDLTPRRGSSR